MELTADEIIDINVKAPSDQGVFFEPYGVQTRHKGKTCVYMRWESGGYRGGSCWDDSDPQYYENRDGKPKFKVLDLVLSILFPNISFLQFREIEELIHSNEETDYEYYGNSTDYGFEYIILDELCELLETFNNDTK